MSRMVSATEIAEARLPLRDVYDLVREGFELWGLGQVECPPKVGVHTRPGAFVHAMPAYLPTKDLVGTKIIGVYPDNPVRHLPSTNGVIVLMDPETGVPTSIVDAGWITSVRTAMVSMVDTSLLANPDPTFGIVGATGVTGRAHIDAIATMFPGSRVLVHSRSPQRLERLLTDYADAACQLEPTGGHEQTVRESDVLIVSTAHLPEPILRTEWLHPGQNVLNVHSRAWPSDVLASVDRVSCDDRRPIMHAEHGLLEVYPGLDPDIELGEVATGQKVGRESPEQIIFSFNYGLAIFDVLVADYVVRALWPGGAAAPVSPRGRGVSAN